MSTPRLFLLDAMALIYRAHFVFVNNPRRTSTGQDVSAVFGFANTLLEILEKEKPTHIAVCFESETPTFREEQFQAYKAQRQEAPQELRDSIPVVKRLLAGFCIPALWVDGYEADDVMGTLAVQAAHRGWDVLLMTPDKDFAQLVNEHIKLYRPGIQGKPHEILGPAEVEAKWGIPPRLMTDFLGLKGDASDNIPGVPKVGDKTAVELLTRFGSLEAILENVDQITKPALKASLLEFGDQGRFSKQLATIHTTVPVEFDEASLARCAPDRPALEALFQELEFRTMLKRVFTEPKASMVAATLFDSPAAPPRDLPAEPAADGLLRLKDVPHTYILCDTPETRAQLVQRLHEANVFCFDTETTGLDALESDIVGLSFAITPGEAYYIPMPDDRDASCRICAEFNAIFQDPNKRKVAQNLKYDLCILRRYGIEAVGPFDDTMLAHYLVQSEGKHNMDAMARQYLQYDPISIEELIGKKGKGQLTMRQVETHRIVEYACEDADITLQLHQRLTPELDKYDVRRCYEQYEMPLVPVLMDMEWQGVRVDTDFLFQYSEELGKELRYLEGQIYQLAGTEFNIGSPKQLGEILFGKLGLGPAKKTATGQFSTDEESLERLAADHELPAKILEYRQLAKLKSTYVDALPTLVNPRTQRVHTSFNQAVAITGRLSSNNPNLQNIPIRTERGREVRKAFLAGSPDHVLLSADYSQIELRVMAHMSGDEGMRQAFLTGEDIHTTTASKVYGVPKDQVSFEQRRNSKMVNFGIIYGISAFGLAQRLRIERSEAKMIIDNYFQQYPGVRAFMDECIARARREGYVSTLSGRRHYLPTITSSNQTVRGYAERNAINTPIQGSAADLIKAAMIQIHARLKDSGLQARMILQVHDELLFDVPRSEVEAVKTLVREGMLNAMPLSVPLEVGLGTGDNWLDAH